MNNISKGFNSRKSRILNLWMPHFQWNPQIRFPRHRFQLFLHELSPGQFIIEVPSCMRTAHPCHGCVQSPTLRSASFGLELLKPDVSVNRAAVEVSWAQGAARWPNNGTATPQSSQSPSWIIQVRNNDSRATFMACNNQITEQTCQKINKKTKIVSRCSYIQAFQLFTATPQAVVVGQTQTSLFVTC